MAVDTSIYQNMLRPAQSPMDYANQYAQAEGQRLNMLMARQQMADQQAAAQERNALAQYLPTADRKAPDALQKLYQVAPRSAPQVIKQWQEQDLNEAKIAHEKANTGKAQGEVAKQKYGAFSNIVQGALLAYQQGGPQAAQQAYQAGVQAARANGMFDDSDLQRLSPNFDPQGAAAFLDYDKEMQRAVTIRGQDVTAETSRRGQDMTDKRTRDEGAANRGVTMRGQNMTDSRARQSNAIQQQMGRIPQGYKLSADGQSLEAIPGGPAATGKALPTKLVTDLSEQAQIADSTARFKNTFNDQFGGKTILGDASNVIGRVLGDDTGQAQWWQDYALHESTIRNKLFGASLTPGEQGQWQKLTVTPRMDPKQIRENLMRRAEIEERALARLTAGSAAAGYNKEQIEAVTGRPIAPKAATVTPPNGQPVKINSDAEYNALPSGATYIAPDGSTRRKK